jgi:hypothetical protein
MGRQRGQRSKGIQEAQATADKEGGIDWGGTESDLIQILAGILWAENCRAIG